MVANAGGGTGASGSFLAPQVQPNVLSLPPCWRPGSQAAAAGLTNLGNSCYLNSTLQNVRTIVEDLFVGRWQSQGVKRLKGAMGGMLRRSEWAAAAAALMRSLKSSGLSLQVVALPRSDERRRELNRVVPRGVLEHGRDELARLLRAALLQLGWLGLGASGSLLL
eukprot:XP_001689868.1 predicted protein [Chlamydomonas reinhardtii]